MYQRPPSPCDKGGPIIRVVPEAVVATDTLEKKETSVLAVIFHARVAYVSGNISEKSRLMSTKIKMIMKDRLFYSRISR